MTLMNKYVCYVSINALCRVPPPLTQGQEADMRLFLFDSWYDKYHGTINLVQVGKNEVRTYKIILIG